MAKKFMIKKKIIIPILVGLMCCPTLTAFASTTTLDTLMSSNSEIILYETQEVNGATSKSLNEQLANLQLDTNDLDTSMTLAMNNNTKSTSPATTKDSKTGKALMEEIMDNLFGTRIVAGEKSGLLQTRYFYNFRISAMDREDDKNTTLSTVIRNPDVQAILYNTGNKTKLAEAAAQAFPDLKNTDGTIHWGASELALPIYTGLISGYPDGTFKANNSVSRAEMSVLVAKAIDKQEMIDTAKGGRTYENCLATGGAEWFATAWASNASGQLGIDRMTGDQSVLYNSGASRAEISFLLVSKYWNDEIRPGGTYYEKAKTNTSYFPDINKVIDFSTRADAETIGMNDVVNLYLDAIKNPNNGIPVEWNAAMMLLKDKGIIVGDLSGNSNWSSSVTRAEAVVIINKTLIQSGKELEEKTK